MASILCVDDEPSVLDVLQQFLDGIGHESIGATSVDEAIRILSHHHVDAALVDYVMPGRDGFAFLDHLREQGIKIPAIMMTGYASLEHAAAAVRAGAADYITKPLRAESVRLVVANALQRRRARGEIWEENGAASSSRGAFSIVGASDALRGVQEVIDAVAPTRAPVLIHGEPGTGKRLFAREIHAKSTRHERPFVAVACVDMLDGPAGEALFGDGDRADGSAPSALERAAGGAILLEEIALLSRDLQERLDRVMETGALERPGGEPIPVDVRIIATTSRNLREEVDAGRFRPDLYRRLDVVSIRTPPLRERADDIPALAEYFAKQKAMELGTTVPAIPAETLTYLQELPWPGNVHELANLIERVMIVHPNRPLAPELLTSRTPIQSSSRSAQPPVPIAAEKAASGEILNLRALQQIAIRQALQKTGGHKTRAAELLGINERTLRNKLRGDRA